MAVGDEKGKLGRPHIPCLKAALCLESKFVFLLCCCERRRRSVLFNVSNNGKQLLEVSKGLCLNQVINSSGPFLPPPHPAQVVETWLWVTPSTDPKAQKATLRPWTIWSMENPILPSGQAQEDHGYHFGTMFAESVTEAEFKMRS